MKMMFNEPLGMPQGSVRAVITGVLLISTIVMHWFGKSDPFVDGLTSLAVGFYIGERAGSAVASPRENSDVILDTTTEIDPEDEDDLEPRTVIPGSKVEE